MTTGYWIAIGTLFNIAVTLVFGYWRNPPLVPSHTVAELRETIRDLRDKLDEAREDNKSLRETNRSLEWSRAYWERQCRELQDKGDKE